MEARLQKLGIGTRDPDMMSAEQREKFCRLAVDESAMVDRQLLPSVITLSSRQL